MRKKIVAGNWKCNTSLQEGVALASEVEKLYAEQGDKNVIVVLGVPATHISEVAKTVKTVAVSAQNIGSEEKGAFTGETSATMAKSAGASYIILGHSERREYYGETNQLLVKKVNITLAHGLTPIFCIGEVLQERESGKLWDVIKSQLSEGLYHLSADQFKQVVIAYEPVWAIGTGKVATPEQAQEMHKFIREDIAGKYGKDVAESISILYGGSCKASNAKEIFSNPDVDGGLIGGASLIGQEFLGVINGFKA